ncbi:MAG: hypothetical protein KF812_01635 [Fimbriimonadaceae bacterium]|nr:hypothetical protein [Fimbriimonadaceae bacterium]
MPHELNDEALSGVIERAHELQMQDQELASYEAFVQAAEEAGVPRESVLQALRERLATAPQFKVDDLVFAPGADGWLYIAKITGLEEGVAQLKFANGADASFTTNKLMSMSLLPNQKVQVNLPGWGGWYGSTVVSINHFAHSLTVNASGIQQTVTMDAVRIRPEVADGKERKFTKTEFIEWVVTAAVSSAVVGALVTWLIMR